MSLIYFNTVVSSVFNNFLPIIPYAFEELKWFFEPILAGVFPKHQIVATTGCHKYDRRHIVEALDPLPALVSLATHVKHTEAIELTDNGNQQWRH